MIARVSPVSRGRGKKNRSSRGPKGRRAPSRGLPPVEPWDGEPSDAPAAHPGANWSKTPASLGALQALARSTPGGLDVVRQSRHWWASSHAETLDAAADLLVCTGPDDLEQAVGDLLGRIWWRMHEEHETGFHHLNWLEELIDAAKPRAGEPAVRRLLYGIAAIATPDLAEAAADLLPATVDAADDATTDDQVPGWLAVPPSLTVSPDLLLLRDGFGLRFGLLAQVTGPGAQPRTYLIDVDVCHGFEHVLAAGYHADVDTAAAAWRDLVGDSATDSEATAAPEHLLPGILPSDDPIGGFLLGPQTRNQYAELFRCGRIITEIVTARHEAGRPLTAPPKANSTQRAERANALAAQFRDWARETGTDLPPATSDDDDNDVVVWLVDDWIMTGQAPELSLTCSPHRIGAFTAYLLDDWLPEPRAQALALLPALASFCLDRTGLTGPAADQVLDRARLAADDPERAAGDLGSSLNRPIDETTLVSPDRPLTWE